MVRRSGYKQVTKGEFIRAFYDAFKDYGKDDVIGVNVVINKGSSLEVSSITFAEEIKTF